MAQVDNDSSSKNSSSLKNHHVLSCFLTAPHFIFQYTATQKKPIYPPTHIPYAFPFRSHPPSTIMILRVRSRYVPFSSCTIHLDTTTHMVYISRDGLERVQVPDDGATVADLRQAISTKLNIPLDDILLSLDSKLVRICLCVLHFTKKQTNINTNKKQAQLTTKDVDDATLVQLYGQELSTPTTPLPSLSLTHGTIVYLLYHFERQVEGVKLSDFDRRPFGAHMTVESMVARQTRIERQETPACSSVSFDMHAANAFQSYVQSALAFSIKRGGILYGTFEEDDSVRVNAIYEPPQEGSADSLTLERGTVEEECADAVASAQGWQKVGWIFTQSTKEREFVCSGEEICQMAAIQSEMGPKAFTAIVAMFPPEDEGAPPEVHFEAFQVSAQCVKLWEEGWFSFDSGVDSGSNQKSTGASATGATMPVNNPKDPLDKTPVIVASKDVAEVEADYFLVPVGIKDHEGPLMTSFPIENRLLPQGAAELRAHLQRYAGKSSYVEKLCDFHLLLYLSKQPGLGAEDVGVLVGAVAERRPVPEGYKIIIDSIAGL